MLILGETSDYFLLHVYSEAFQWCRMVWGITQTSPSTHHWIPVSGMWKQNKLNEATTYDNGLISSVLFPKLYVSSIVGFWN